MWGSRAFPELLVFVLLGVSLSWGGRGLGWETGVMEEGLHFLSKVGLVALLFRVGLDSDLTGLLDKLPKAVPVWLVNVIVTIPIGYATCSLLLGYDWVPSLVVGVAFSATSVGVTASVWEETDQIDTAEGRLFVDVAELDDVSAVCLMALLFATLPHFAGGNSLDAWIVVEELGLFLGKFVLFGAVCVLFSRYLEKPISDVVFESRVENGMVLLMVGTLLIIASVAGLLGFSLAVGALFAGLVFSRDPMMVREEASFQILYNLFTPFFFLMIGWKVHPTFTVEPLVIGSMLFVMATFSKFFGAGIPAYLVEGKRAGVLLGLSMIPRSEILLLIMKKGLEAKAGFVTDELYEGMVLVSIGTCLVGIIGLGWYLTPPGSDP